MTVNKYELDAQEFYWKVIGKIQSIKDMAGDILNHLFKTDSFGSSYPQNFLDQYKLIVTDAWRHVYHKLIQTWVTAYSQEQVYELYKYSMTTEQGIIKAASRVIKKNYDLQKDTLWRAKKYQDQVEEMTTSLFHALKKANPLEEKNN